MKYELAEQILKNTMTHWSQIQMSDETKDIQIISEIKYDDYQQYTHGMRFVESLALWMRQFGNESDKDCAYDLIKNKLIYISEEEMRQLVSNAFSVAMKKYLLERMRLLCDDKGVYTTEERKRIFEYYKRKSLFLGLSDGAHMDFFRRQNPSLGNEQVFVHYDFSESKLKDMKENLQKDQYLKLICRKYGMREDYKFIDFFLIDDFMGSGKSYIRRDEKGWHGKIKKFFERMGKLKYEKDKIYIHLVLFVSTEKALQYVAENAREYTREIGANEITVECIQIVQPINWGENAQLKDLLTRNYEEYSKKCDCTYVDEHFKVGEGKEPYLGFADGSFPLILYHNTPNNSLPVLWYSWDNMVNALFMRVTRHKEIQ